MRFYPDIAARRASAIVSDLFILVLLVLLAWLGLKIHDAVGDLASVRRGVSDGGSAIQRGSSQPATPSAMRRWSASRSPERCEMPGQVPVV